MRPIPVSYGTVLNRTFHEGIKDTIHKGHCADGASEQTVNVILSDYGYIEYMVGYDKAKQHENGV